MSSLREEATAFAEMAGLPPETFDEEEYQELVITAIDSCRGACLSMALVEYREPDPALIQDAMETLGWSDSTSLQEALDGLRKGNWQRIYENPEDENARYYERVIRSVYRTAQEILAVSLHEYLLTPENVQRLHWLRVLREVDWNHFVLAFRSVFSQEEEQDESVSCLPSEALVSPENELPGYWDDKAGKKRAFDTDVIDALDFFDQLSVVSLKDLFDCLHPSRIHIVVSEGDAKSIAELSQAIADYGSVLFQKRVSIPTAEFLVEAGVCKPDQFGLVLKTYHRERVFSEMMRVLADDSRFLDRQFFDELKIDFGIGTNSFYKVHFPRLERFLAMLEKEVGGVEDAPAGYYGFLKTAVVFLEQSEQVDRQEFFENWPLSDRIVAVQTLGTFLHKFLDQLNEEARGSAPPGQFLVGTAEEGPSEFKADEPDWRGSVHDDDDLEAWH